MSDAPTGKQIARGCRFFNGIHHKECEAGIAYEQFLGQNYDKFPCHTKKDGTLTGACGRFEFYTMAELETQDKETARLVEDWVTSINNDVCPDCHAKVERKEQIGRCVYGFPCGHRLYQGKLKKSK